MSKKDYPTIALGTWSWGKGMAGGDQVFGNNVGVRTYSSLRSSPRR